MTPPATPERRKQRRTWPQRLTLVVVAVAAFACFAAAGAIAAGQWVLSQRNLAPLGRDHLRALRCQRPRRGRSPIPTTGADDGDAAEPTLPAPTRHRAAIGAGRARGRQLPRRRCRQRRLRRRPADRGSQRSRRAQRHDHGVAGQPGDQPARRAVVPTRPVRRVSRAAARTASTPPTSATIRRSSRRCINFNFGIQIDHYIQIDFCAFRRLVNAVGGIEIPFEFPARDTSDRRRTRRCS